MARSLASGLVLLVFSAFLAAQRDSGIVCQLTVRVVRATDDRPIGTLVQIQVLSTQEIVIATTDVVGGDPANFNVGNGKAYSLKVSGAGIEPVTTPFFEINTLESDHLEIVRVKPDLKNQPGESTEPGPPSVSIGELEIPPKAVAEMNKGLDAYSKGEMEKASSHFEKAAAEYPQFARAYDLLGAIAMREHNRAKARELFSKSIQADSTYPPAYVDLARLDFQDRKYSEAESLLTKAIDMNPSMPDAVALLATTEFANREYDKALADVQRIDALPNHQQFAGVHLLAARVLRMQNHPQQAIAQFQLFLKEKPDSPEAETVRKTIASLEAGQQR